MKARIEESPDAEVSLIKSGGGVFEIERGGDLVYSKRATGRFPTEDEVSALTSA